MQSLEDAYEEGDASDWETASDVSDHTPTPAALNLLPSTLPPAHHTGSMQAHAGSSTHSQESLERSDAAPDDWQAWNPCCSLFDNHVSESLEANLEYMWRRYRFSIPDAEFLRDPAGLLNYLVRGCV